jgi:hypothetical protein
MGPERVFCQRVHLAVGSKEVEPSRRVRSKTMKMSRIERCDATKCAYNSDGACHALGITIGHDGGCPDCDTFFVTESKGGDQGK